MLSLKGTYKGDSNVQHLDLQSKALPFKLQLSHLQKGAVIRWTVEDMFYVKTQGL